MIPGLRASERVPAAGADLFAVPRQRHGEGRLRLLAHGGPVGLAHAGGHLRTRLGNQRLVVLPRLLWVPFLRVG